MVTVGFHSRSDSISNTDISQGNDPYALANATLSTGMSLSSDNCQGTKLSVCVRERERERLDRGNNE